DQIGRHAVDDRLDREIRLGELGDGFAPADLAVIRRDLGRAERARGCESGRLGIADGDGFDLGDFHGGPQPIAPLKWGMPATPTSTFSSRPPMEAGPLVSKTPKSAT